MNVKYEASFQRDLKNIRDKNFLREIKNSVDDAKKAESVLQINNLKKLKGYKTFYRIRLGDYRIGVEIVEGEIIFVRFLHRREVYRFFP